MNMKREPLGCALWFLCVGLVVSCDWRPLDNDLGAPSFLEDGPTVLERLDISDPAECREECCDDLRCQMALLGFPADGPAECLLVRCLIGGHNVCELSPNSQYQLVGWKKPLKAVPLVEASQPSKNDSTNLCLQPMKVGSCRAAFPKFYYDVVNQTCRNFTYGGCDANGNNFESREDCEATCNGVTGSVLPEASTRPRSSVKSLRMAQPIDEQSELWDDALDKVLSAEDYSERCEAEPMAGPCRAAFRAWYYDSQEHKCKTFIYGGCQGNKNNYDSQQSCLDTCYVSVGPTHDKLLSSDSPSVSEDDCLSSPDPGPCRAAFPKFYYDPATGSCQSFIYGGCGGNKNQYSSTEECQTRCNGATDGYFAGRDKTRSRWTAAFFVLLTLAAICTVLVSTLVVTMLRRLTLPRRASVVSDKEELLPEVRSSLESLNIPAFPISGKA